MNPPNPNKRLRRDVTSSIQNPNFIRDFNESEFDSIISSFILLPDHPPSSSIDSSLDRVFGKVLSLAAQASGDDDDSDSIQDLIINRTNKLALFLQQSTKRFSRMRVTLYNSNSWFLPNEITIKIFSMLDTMSLIKASATCTMFRQCSLDPLCYSHIQLTANTRSSISDEVVSSLILRAGNELRSLQLGRVRSQYKRSLVTRSCLASLTLNPGFNGGVLRSLHLHNLKSTGTKSLCDLLLVCPNLTDLKISNFNRKYIVEEVLKTLTKNTHSILERLFLHNSFGFIASGVSCSTAEAFVSSCPNLTSLTIVGFDLKDDAAKILAEGFPKLNYMDLSRTPSIIGRFLRDMINSLRDSPLKTLKLHNCPNLDKKNVMQFLDLLIKGHFKSIRHIDVSREHGYGVNENVILKNLLMKLKEERSDVTALA